LIFSFTDKLLKETPLTIIEKDKTPVKSFYTIGVHPNITVKINTDFYFDIGYYSPKPTYFIKSITKNKMILQMVDANSYKLIEGDIIYIRKTSLDFADEILEGLDSN
jgi:hypothetical protein